MRKATSRASALVAIAAGIAGAVAELAELHARSIEAIGWPIAGFTCAALLIANGKLGERLEERDRRLANDAATIDLAEQLAGLGRWSAWPDGRQEWSEGLLRLVGLPPGCAPDQQTRHELLPDGGRHFQRCLQDHARDTEPFVFEFEINRADGRKRIVRVIAQNVFDRDGTPIERNGVAMDVTEERNALDRLGKERSEALLRAEEALALAETDPLTGLHNRRRAMREMEKAVVRAGRSGEPLALILVDIDHFKAVNDTHGHQAGDAVLVRVGQILGEVCRESDLVARIGGEEFLWLLPGMAASEARSAAERLRCTIARDSAVAGVPPVTASIGLACWEPGDAAIGLFARADAALYAAKHGGRNTIRKAA